LWHKVKTVMTCGGGCRPYILGYTIKCLGLMLLTVTVKIYWCAKLCILFCFKHVFLLVQVQSDVYTCTCSRYTKTSECYISCSGE